MISIGFKYVNLSSVFLDESMQLMVAINNITLCILYLFRSLTGSIIFINEYFWAVHTFECTIKEGQITYLP